MLEGVDVGPVRRNLTPAWPAWVVAQAAALASCGGGAPSVAFGQKGRIEFDRSRRAPEPDVVSPAEVRRIEKRRSAGDTSAENREGKTFTLAIEVPSFLPWPGGGLAAGLFVRPDFLLEVAASYHVGWSGPSRLEQWSAEFYQLHGRFFFANSFSLTGGGAAYVFRETKKYEPYTDGGEDPTSQSFLLTTGLHFTLGNHWQWDTFTLGVEWVGIYVPFFVADRAFVPSGLSDEEKDYEKRKFESASPIVVPEFLKVRFGLSF